MKKRIIKTIVLILVMSLVLLSACGNSKPKEQTEPDEESQEEESDSEAEPEPESEQEPEPEPEPDVRTMAFTSYRDLLVENESGILGYSFQNGHSDYNYYPEGLRPVAFADLNGDDVEELLFFSSEDGFGIAELSIYTYVNEAVKEIVLGEPYEGNYQYDGGHFHDTNVAAGTNYVIYTNKAEDSLYIYHSMGDESMSYQINKFQIDKDGNVKIVERLRNTVGPNEDYSGKIDVYHIDEVEVPFDDGAKAFTERFKDIGRVLISSYFHGYMPDESIWKNFDESDVLSMSLNNALIYLNKEIGGQEGGETLDSIPDAALGSYSFSSGAGGWGSWLDLAADGTFQGNFHDSEMGDQGEGYPHGTVYTCDFTGRFSDIKLVSDGIYSLELTELDFAEPGAEEIKDEVRYITAEPYGLNGGKSFLLLAPGTAKSYISQDAAGWMYGVTGISYDEITELPAYFLYDSEVDYLWAGPSL